MDRESKEQLLDIIDTIAGLEDKIVEVERERRRVVARLEVIRARVTLDVGRARDDGARLLYTNEHSRHAAVILRLDENGDYQSLRERSWQLEDQSRGLAIERDKLLDRRLILMVELGISQPEGTNGGGPL
jgi:hypothetical protein